MAKRRLTLERVKDFACQAGQDRTILWDDDPRGFGVVVYPTGKKTYVLQYRADGRSRRLALGEHGRITLDQARTLAKKATGAIADGKDPVEARRQERGGPSFNELADGYMARHVKTKRKPRTYEEYDRLLRLHLRPKLGTKKAGTITKADIARLHHGMADTPGAANRAVAVFSAIWNWADDGSPSPAEGLELYPEEGVERFLTQAEFGRLGAAMRQAETIGLPWAEAAKPSKHRPKTERPIVVDPYAVAALRLLLFTGARLREILHLRWDEIDIGRGIIFLPDSKSRKKPIYLSGAVIKIIKALPRPGADPYVIAGVKEHRDTKGRRVYKPRADLKRPWAAIRRAAKLGDFRIHDLRHTFASTGVGSSLGLPIIGKLIGHKRPETTQRYAHLETDPMARAANLIGDRITAALQTRTRFPVNSEDD